MTSPYTQQQLDLINEMQRQQHLLHYQMLMGVQTNAQANSLQSQGKLSGPMMIPQQAKNNMQGQSSAGYGSPTIVVVESEEEDVDDEEERTLFVANIDDRVTEELLYEVFLQTGPIERVRIPKDNNGRKRAFGFVTFKHRCSPPYAMNLLQGLSLYRKTLTIKFNGKTFPPTLRTPVLGLGSNSEKHNDNSALRSGNYSGYMNNTPTSSRQEYHSKYGPSQGRHHLNTNPFNQQPQQRRDSPNHYNDHRRYHSNQRSSGNNGNSGRYSDHRNSSSGGSKPRR